MANPNNPEYLEKQCPLPYSGSKSGYIRHDVDCKEVADADDGVLVKQKVSDIEYRNFNMKYQRSVLEPVASNDITVNKHPDHVAISNGWNSKFIKQVWWDGSSYQEKVGGLSEKYVTQSLYKGWILNDDGSQTEKTYADYVLHDVCNYEVLITTTPPGPGRIITPMGDVFLALESDRDNTIINEERTLAILLEDNTILSQVDYETDYFVREEDDISLSYESGGLIEPA